MLMGHRQAWVWQDEWYGLTISDIRELEKETQKMLAKKMGNVSDPNLSSTMSNEDDVATLKRPSLKGNPRGSTIELLWQESLEARTVEQDVRPEKSWKIGSFESSDTDEEFFDAEGKTTFQYSVVALWRYLYMMNDSQKQCLPLLRYT